MQAVVSLSEPQAAPPWAVAVVVVRVRFASPAAQVLEQALQVAKAVCWQSTGQACVLHVASAVFGPQLLPPCSTSVVVVRARVVLPVPHDLVHAVQAVQPD